MTTPPAERTLSHWGWGWADKFPDADERAALGQQVAVLLGLSEVPSPGEPVSLAEASLPTPTLTIDALPDALTGIARDSRYDRALRTWGRAWPDIYRGFTGDFSAAPDLVLCPRTEDDVAAAIAWASAEGVALVPFGGGTTVVAGTECSVGQGWVGVVSLDMRGMDRLLEVDAHSGLARIEAGATGPRLEAQLADHGLAMRHFPQSFEFSTVGGWIATRSGGHYATLYTHIDDRVASVRMITPTGTYESRLLPGSGAGPSPDRALAIGSEGILGVITSAWLRVVERPRHRARASVRFARFEDAVEAARAVARSGLYPANCRVLDGREAMLFGVAYDGSSVLLLGFESSDHPVAHDLERTLELAREHGGQVADEAVRIEDRQEPDAATEAAPGDHASWREAFIDAPYLVNSMVSLGMIADTFETACTWSAFPALHARLVEVVRATMKRECGRGLLTCRFTHVYPDGPAPYYTFVAPAGGDPRGALARWQAIKEAASDVLIEHGATITHHHAVGRRHRPWYARQCPEPYARVLRATKRELDPHGVLNPGVLVDVERAGREP